MFSAVVRAAIVLAVGSLLWWVLGIAAEELFTQHLFVAPSPPGDGDGNVVWASRFMTWFPAILLGSACAILITNAITRRRRTP